jgi:hypothetical protein
MRRRTWRRLHSCAKRVYTPRDSSSAEWHITYRCNLACVHCNRLSFIPQCIPDMTPADAENFVAQAAAMDWHPMISILGGEPTLHPRLLDFIRIAGKLSDSKALIHSNGFSPESKTILSGIRESGIATIAERTNKRKGSVVHPMTDWFISPLDIDPARTEPHGCRFHTSYRRSRCGISVDSLGYTICPIGGTIDSFLELGIRTTRLADLFDPVFAEKQSKALCLHCGQGCPLVTPELRDSLPKVNGTPVSRTWEAAINKMKKP